MRSFSFILSLLFLTSVSAQEIQMSETASLEQIYGEVQEAEELLPMNELGLEFGYALYEATITAEEENPVLTVENVRDYAAVYVDGKLQGWMTEEKKAIPLQVIPFVGIILITIVNTYGNNVCLTRFHKICQFMIMRNTDIINLTNLFRIHINGT